MAKEPRLAKAKSVAALVGTSGAGTWRELVLACGEPAVITAKAHGLIVPVLPGVYSLPGLEADFRVRASALSRWAAPVGLVTGIAASNLWHVTEESPQRITLHVPPAWHLATPQWARLLRVDPPPRRFRLGGITLVSAADAVIQSWREARPDIAAGTVILAVQRKVTTAAELFEALARRRHMPRRQHLVELLTYVGESITSYLEYIAHRDVFPPRLYPHLQWQVNVWGSRGLRIMDAFDPEALIDLEFDGFGSHGGKEAFESDRQRDNEMRAMGYEPLHFTYRDLTARPEWCRQIYHEVREARLRLLLRGSA